MKKNLLLIIASCLFTARASAQVAAVRTATDIASMSFNRAYHDKDETPAPFVLSILGDLYFMAEGNGLGYLYRHSTNGTLGLRTYVPGIFSVKQGIASNDNKLAVAMGPPCGDVIPAMQSNAIGKVDLNGTVIFTSTYSVHYFDDPKAFLQLPSDSSYVTFTDSMMVRHNKNGQLLLKVNTGLSSISSALILPNNTLLVSAKQNGSSSFVTLSVNAQTLSAVSTPTLFTKMSFYGGQKIMALGRDNKFYKFRPSLSLIAASSNTNSATINNFICQADTIRYIFGTATNPSNYAERDSSFNTISMSSTTTHSIVQRALCGHNGMIGILAAGRCSTNSFSSGPRHEFSSLSLIYKGGDNNFENDVAVVSVAADSSYMQCTPYPLQPGYYICDVFLRAGVTVKNTGSTQISSFRLNYYIYDNFCGPIIYQKLYSNMTLAPGATVSVLTDFVQRSMAPAATGTANLEFCYYSSVPNGETDKVLEDNRYCYTHNFMVSSLSDHSLSQVNLTIAPNPFNSELSIEADLDIRTVELVNALGVTLLSRTVNGRNAVIPASELPAGIYFVRIITDKDNLIRKTIRQ